MTKAIKETIFNDCPIRNVLARISDKWSLLVMYALNHNGAKATRFGELRKLIPDISQKMLTSTLRTLETDGYVTRQVFAEVPPRVEYSLTERAISLIQWALDNMADILFGRNKNKWYYERNDKNA